MFIPVSVPVVVMVSFAPAFGQIEFEPEEFILADGDAIAVPGYSVPSFAHWDGDDLMDLIVGEGGGSESEARVRVYLNRGAPCAPEFSEFFYARSNGAPLLIYGSGCLGVFPRVVYWDSDARKDLLIGLANGDVLIFLNDSTDESPSFDAGSFVQVGTRGSKVRLNVGYRATPSVVDWNNDGRKDLIVGAMDGLVRVFINEGTDTSPEFLGEARLQDGDHDLQVPDWRSSPAIADLDGDGNKDLLVGNTEGVLLFYRNVGDDAAPVFSGHTPAMSNGVPIDLPDTARSRPCVCDWSGDGVLDVLVGGGDGASGPVRLFRGAEAPDPPVDWDFDCDADVDLVDFASFHQCVSGPHIAASPGCAFFDFDADGDVDAADYAGFQVAFTG